MCLFKKPGILRRIIRVDIKNKSRAGVLAKDAGPDV
jgi:hypothetical protein